jgi:DNA-binding NarL/FixJ family response regulator
MLTNQGQLSDIEKAKSFGVDGYIIKATTIPSEVVAEVTRIYNLHKNV